MLSSSDIRHDWTKEEVLRLFALPFNDLLFEAQSMHRKYFNPNEVQISTLLSIKTGGCAEDCSYCPQAAQYDTGVKAQKLMQKEAVMEEAQKAKAAGASRFCMGAAWRNGCSSTTGVTCAGWPWSRPAGSAARWGCRSGCRPCRTWWNASVSRSWGQGRPSRCASSAGRWTPPTSCTVLA
jgi:hypothetical protein